MRKRGHWQAFVTAEDGSLLRVIGNDHQGAHRATQPTARPRRGILARFAQDDAQDTEREVRETYGLAIR